MIEKYFSVIILHAYIEKQKNIKTKWRKGFENYFQRIKIEVTDSTFFN